MHINSSSAPNAQRPAAPAPRPAAFWSDLFVTCMPYLPAAPLSALEAPSARQSSGSFLGMPALTYLWDTSPTPLHEFVTAGNIDQYAAVFADRRADFAVLHNGRTPLDAVLNALHEASLARSTNEAEYILLASELAKVYCDVDAAERDLIRDALLRAFNENLSSTIAVMLLDTLASKWIVHNQSFRNEISILVRTWPSTQIVPKIDHLVLERMFGNEARFRELARWPIVHDYLHKITAELGLAHLGERFATAANPHPDFTAEFIRSYAFECLCQSKVQWLDKVLVDDQCVLALDALKSRLQLLQHEVTSVSRRTDCSDDIRESARSRIVRVALPVLFQQCVFIALAPQELTE